MKRHLILFFVFIVIFIAIDKLIEKIMTPYFLYSGQVKLNAYDIVRRDHPEKIWNKVIYGNSVTVGAYREDISTSGYINAGIAAGQVDHLWGMIKTKKIKIGSELVIAFNSALSIYDDFFSDPTYPWFRKWYEPYCYFERDKLREIIKRVILTYVFRKNMLNKEFKNQRRVIFFGAMTAKELDEKLNTELFKSFYNIKFSDLKKNIKAIDKITKYCQSNSIRLRFVWNPPNPTIESFPASILAYEYIKKYAKENSIDFLDLSGKLDKEYYYDQNHLNHEYGSHKYTEIIDPWLKTEKTKK